MVNAPVDLYFHKRDIPPKYRPCGILVCADHHGVSHVPGASRHRVLPAAGASPFPVLDISWDFRAHRAPSCTSCCSMASPASCLTPPATARSFILPSGCHGARTRSKLVAARLRREFSLQRRKSKPAPPQIEPWRSIQPASGTWMWISCTDRHPPWIAPATEAGRLTGSHQGTTAHGDIEGSIAGDRVRFPQHSPIEGMRLVYTFEGTISGDNMSGNLDLGEYGSATWKASRKA